MADTTSGVNGIGYTSTQTTGTTTTPKKELDQESFLKLLTMQLSYQDPFKPVDNAQMLSQMTSMSTSQGISSLSNQIGSLNTLMTSSQALQASALVGQNVLLQSNVGYLEKDGSLPGVVAVGTENKYSNVKITIEDESGQVIKEFPLEGDQKGNVEIVWDGKDKDGNPAKEGKYTLKANGTVDGKSESVPIFAYGKVDSVILGSASNPTQLNLKGLGTTSLNSILQIAGTVKTPSTTTPTASI
ncbi:flagellar hook assembly protein FlgD [Aeromonas dhakensis]|uniref:flagellar hook assembly protein FlgD n=1 Tax=Aeromonas TaxID=642 RepID=UPI00034BFCB7|nr:flagellar hook assembly protein FlgD [Aeromonas dhakensis]AHV34603.1 flagellar biosynthesis protein FlgD [Aeromonas hydrophila YL17]KMK98237.1 flagellar basal body rod modification protein FlgD [Aeromonas enteropelogenes]MBF8450011.1 flagellar hook assembly protein FlgD [Aeromonas dhakensis]MBL0523914.1 flagellar hook assembly protein FlgD [Aeromonas dhakensis]MBL0619558.1 flagellar hook assembly protein FlgD [Aeromonas dhakensis]